MPIKALTITSKLRDYSVNFCRVAEFLPRLLKQTDRLFVVDENVLRLYGRGCLAALPPAETIGLPIAEEKKNFEAVQFIYDRVIGRSAKKNLKLVAIGGGILQDIAGFAASTLYRGIDWSFVPTTLLAQADSCIGAKTSLNYRNFKNLIGTFYPPSVVYISPEFLATLQPADYYSGLGEMAKLHLMGGEGDSASFMRQIKALAARDENILLETIQRALLIKKGYIEEDEFDAGRRNLLNFGHCFGHAIETATDFAVPHGQAVVLGMMLAGQVAAGRKLLSPQLRKYIEASVLRPSLNLPAQFELDNDRIISSMKQDKKRLGEGLVLVMLTDGYRMIKIDDLSETEAAAALAWLGEVLA